MTARQLAPLFAHEPAATSRLRLTTVLTAVYMAVFYRQQAGNTHLELTDPSNGVSIDEVMRHLNAAFGAPQRPVDRPIFPIHETIGTLFELIKKGYLDTSGPEFCVITLTEYLFESLGEEVAAS